MFNILGYDVEQKIYEGTKTTIYSGVRLIDSVPVLFKLLYAEYPDLHDVNKFKKEYELNQLINSDNIVKIHNIEYYEKTPVLILVEYHYRKF